MDVCWAQIFHECWGYKLRFSCTCSHNFTYRAIPRPQSYNVKKDGMTHIWRSTLPIGCGLTRGASLGETDYGIFHFISHWEQVSKDAHKPAGGPCPRLLPLEPELIVSLQTSLGSQQRGSSSEILPQRVYSLPGWNLGYFESLVLANSIL